MNEDQEKLIALLEGLEYREIEEIVHKTPEEIKELGSHQANITKLMNRRLKQFKEEIENLYDRKDMMEFGEFVAKRYDLKGMNEWIDSESAKVVNKTVNDILNDFERNRKLDENEIDKDLNRYTGKDISDILFG